MKKVLCFSFLVANLFIIPFFPNAYAQNSNSAWGEEIQKLLEQLALLENQIQQLAQNIVKLDMVTVSRDVIGPNVSVLHNDNNTNVFSRLNLSDDRKPMTVSAGDLDNDGHQDIVIGNNLSPRTVSVFLGNGNGTFGSMISTSDTFAGQPSDLEILDFNSDSDQDVAVLTSSNIYLFNGTGTGTLNLNQTFPFDPVLSARDFTIGDIDNDGIMDIVAASDNGSTDGRFTILNHTGGNIMTNDIDAFDPIDGVGVGVTTLALNDFDGDSNLDIVAASKNAAKIIIYSGNGRGNFSFLSKIDLNALIEQPTDVRSGDFNNDTNADIVTLDNLNKVNVRIGNGDGTFGTPQSYSIRATPFDIEIGDLNLNGKLDIAIISQSDDSVQVLLGNGDGTFNPRFFEFGVEKDPWDLVLVELDTQ